jgi:hypothetical protein
LAVVADLAAETGSKEAEPLFGQLRRDSPVESEALAGVLAWRQQKPHEAADRLSSALRRLRSEPWMLERVRLMTLTATIGVAQSDPSQARKLLDALGQPFAAFYTDEARRQSACVVAEQVGPAVAARFVESFEPFVPWNEPFLEYRRQIYRAAGHPFGARAERDLQDFLR